MAAWRMPGLRKAVLWIFAAAAVVIIGALAFAWSGLYSVAASRGHWPPTVWFLELAMRSSVRTHSFGITPPPLDNTDLIRLGAGHFESGCAPCHGAPGAPSSPVVRQMLPSPPPLAEAARHWKARELFWIAKNGLKYTGMPAWVAQERDDEVWAVVAFLNRLPGLDPTEYAALVRADLSQRRASRSGPDDAAPPSATLATCVGCHGDETSPPTSRLVPELAGLSAGYLRLALRQYAEGLRKSGIMQPIAAGLGTAEIDRLSAYYSGIALDRPDVASVAPPPDQIERGRRIATAGIAKDGIPPCLACHGRNAREVFPRLAGQQAPYIAAQLRLWQRGLRDDTVTGAIMAPIARRLTSQQIEDVAAYFASRPPHTTEGREASQEFAP